MRIGIIQKKGGFVAPRIIDEETGREITGIESYSIEQHVGSGAKLILVFPLTDLDIHIESPNNQVQP